MSVIRTPVAQDKESRLLGFFSLLAWNSNSTLGSSKIYFFFVYTNLQFKLKTKVWTTYINNLSSFFFLIFKSFSYICASS